MNDFEPLSSPNRRGFAQRLKESRCVENPQALLSDDDSAAKFCGAGSEAILDLGPDSPGGYPVFTVKSVGKPCVLRISYADRWLVYEHEKGRNIGDFERGSCKYLGIELPVLPANPGRYELYTVTRTGEYIFPLVQGQQRFVRLALEGDGELEISRFYILRTSDIRETKGSFSCSDSALTSLYRVSEETVKIATVTANQWDFVNGKLLLRSLNRAEDAAVHKEFGGLSDCEMEAEAWIARNPDQGSGVGFVLRGTPRSGYAAFVDLDGCVRCYLRRDGVNQKLLFDGRIEPLTDCKIYTFRFRAEKNRFTLSVDGSIAATFEDGTFSVGSFGFCQTIEKWAVVTGLRVYRGNQKIYEEDFSDPKRYTAFIGKPFLADGAKRDRLPWSGDLDWSARNAYYGMEASKTPVRDTIDLFLAKQTPEGYIQATCYPEDRSRLRRKEWGHYESDLFSAWMLPVAEDYVLYSGDIRWLKRSYPKLAKSLYYLIPFVEADGLFNQRYETSKGLWDHQLGDRGKHAYNNVIIGAAFRDGATLAGYLGEEKDRRTFEEYYLRIREGLNRHLFDEERGYFVKSVNRREYCNMANAAALSEKMVDADRAARIAAAMKEHDFPHGKILLLAIRGLYEYGLTEQAQHYLVSDNYFENDWNFTGSISWYHIAERDDYPHTTTECMHFPAAIDKSLGSWGDLSHPDTAVAHILCGEILGVRPNEAGFRSAVLDPKLGSLQFAQGVIPTPYGPISAHVSAGAGGMLHASVDMPENIRLFVSESVAELTVNGKSVSPETLHLQKR